MTGTAIRAVSAMPRAGPTGASRNLIVMTRMRTPIRGRPRTSQRSVAARLMHGEIPGARTITTATERKRKTYLIMIQAVVALKEFAPRQRLASRRSAYHQILWLPQAAEVATHLTLDPRMDHCAVIHALVFIVHAVVFLRMLLLPVNNIPSVLASMPTYPPISVSGAIATSGGEIKKGILEEGTDHDGDSYPGGFAYAASGTDRSKSELDCYDSNANAYPGQTSYFTTVRGSANDAWGNTGNSSDYNCDGVETQSMTTKETCSGIYPNCSGFPGWGGPTPACGTTATYDTCISATGCITVSTETQSCH